METFFSNRVLFHFGDIPNFYAIPFTEGFVEITKLTPLYKNCHKPPRLGT